MPGTPSIYWIPLLALLSAGWVEKSPKKTSGLITVTGTDGQPDLVQAAHVYAVHEGSRRIKNKPLTRIHAVGRKPFEVRESVEQVMSLLAGDWVKLELARARKAVFVSVNEISTVEASILKSLGATEPFSDIQFVDGSRLRVRESPSNIRSLLGNR